MRILLILLISVSSILSVEVGKVEDYRGRVDLLKKDHLKGVLLSKSGISLEVGDILRTKRNGYALVSFIDRSKVELFEFTRLKILGYREVNLQRGIVKFEVESLKDIKGFKVRTPHVLIGVKGTVFWVYVFPGFTRIVVQEGDVEKVYKFSIREKSWEQVGIQPEVFIREEPFSEKPPFEAFLEVRLQ